MPRVAVVAGMGFGDEGKGTITEFLVNKLKAKLVVRYNGGAQAAHNVITDDYKHHTFAQWGSGTFQGADTYLSQYVLVSPTRMIKEAEHLQDFGIDPWPMVRIHKDAPLLTAYHHTTNKLDEDARGENRHGSCGIGIGVCREWLLEHGEAMPTVGDIRCPERLEEKLAFTALLAKRRHPEAFDADTLAHMNEGLCQRYADLLPRLQIVGDDYLPEMLSKHNVVFEGAQGVLLDQWYGFYPHTTWTDTTFNNANVLLAGYSGERQFIGVTRTFQTRHGAGPLPTEFPVKSTLPYDYDNGTGEYQGAFRVGYLDLPLMRYALKVLGHVDSIAMTHLDTYNVRRELDKVCYGYKDASLEDRLSEVAVLSEPGLATMARLGKRIVSTGKLYNSMQPVEAVQAVTGKSIGILSFGPKLSDKSALKDI